MAVSKNQRMVSSSRSPLEVKHIGYLGGHRQGCLFCPGPIRAGCYCSKQCDRYPVSSLKEQSGWPRINCVAAQSGHFCQKALVCVKNSLLSFIFAISRGTLCLIATWFLICEIRRGEKIYISTDGSPGSHSAGYAVATRVRSQTSRLADALCEAKKQTPRVGSFSPL